MTIESEYNSCATHEHRQTLVDSPVPLSSYPVSSFSLVVSSGNNQSSDGFRRGLAGFLLPCFKRYYVVVLHFISFPLNKSSDCLPRPLHSFTHILYSSFLTLGFGYPDLYLLFKLKNSPAPPKTRMELFEMN